MRHDDVVRVSVHQLSAYYQAYESWQLVGSMQLPTPHWAGVDERSYV